MSADRRDNRLTSRELAPRAGFLVALICGGIALRAFDPVAVSWLPLRTSCGAVTGLPCIFCGATRALHCLLNGDFARALYFNWLAFPVAASALGLIVILLAELGLRRRLVRAPKIRITRRSFAAASVALLALWILQVTLAVSFHKHELLNPNGPLYALFVK